MTMVRYTVGFAMLLSAAAEAQTLQTRACNETNIAFIEETIAKMQDGKQKKTAIDEIALARDALTQSDDDECKSHLLKATLQTK